MRVKKKMAIVGTILLSCLMIFFLSGKQVFASDNGGGSITTPGKITFEVEKTEPSKEKDKDEIKVLPKTFAKMLPKTGESNTNFSGLIGVIIIGSSLFYIVKNRNQGGEQS